MLGLGGCYDKKSGYDVTCLIVSKFTRGCQLTFLLLTNANLAFLNGVLRFLVTQNFLVQVITIWEFCDKISGFLKMET